MESGESVTFSCEPDCSWLNQELDILSGNQTIENFKYSCFEHHPFWGGFTFSCTVLPGVALLYRLLHSKEVRNSFCRIFVAILASLIFPVTLFCVKITSFFQFGEEWKRVATLVTACESQVESFLQAGLQVYIIAGNIEREASGLQILAVLGSLFMIGLGQVKAAFTNRSPGASMFEDIKKIAFFSFASFFMIYLFISTAVIIAFIDKITIFVSCGIIVILALTYLILTRLKSSCLPQNFISKRKIKLIMLTLVWLIGLINCIIGLVIFNMDPDSYNKVKVLKNQSTGNKWLGMGSAANLILFIICLIAVFRK